jgi:hypothetical protein
MKLPVKIIASIPRSQGRIDLMTDYAIPVDNLIELLKEVEDNPELFGPFYDVSHLITNMTNSLGSKVKGAKELQEEFPELLAFFLSEEGEQAMGGGSYINGPGVLVVCTGNGCWAQLKKPALRGLDKLRTSPKEELPRILVKFTSSNQRICMG